MQSNLQAKQTTPTPTPVTPTQTPVVPQNVQQPQQTQQTPKPIEQKPTIDLKSIQTTEDWKQQT
jgi:hypothetical protein